MTAMDDDATSDPAKVHDVLSQIAFGEEEDAFLQAISLEVALQLPWTTQLRLCLRLPSTFDKVLLPHVWRKVQKHLYPDYDDEMYDNDSWKLDCMIQNWALTRIHIQRDLPILSNTLRLIMKRIDSVVNLHDEPTCDYEEGNLVLKLGKSPMQVIHDFKEKRSLTSSTRNATVYHRNFCAWVATFTTDHDQLNDYVLALCRQIGLRRSGLKRLEEQLHTLPLQCIVRGLLSLQSHHDQVVRKGMVLCAALLKRNGVDIPLDQLPHDWLLTTTNSHMSTKLDKRVMNKLDSYLHRGIPNVNALVVFLWTHSIHMENWVSLVSWLPVEPVLQLLQRSISRGIDADDGDDWERGLDFFLALPWEQHHLLKVFEPLLGRVDVPTDPLVLKEACRVYLAGHHSTFKATRHSTSQHSSTNAIVEQVWGKQSIVDGEGSPRGDDNKCAEDVDMSDDSSDDFDDSDDRILLLTL